MTGQEMLLTQPLNAQFQLQIRQMKQAAVVIFGLGVQVDVEGSFEEHEHVGPVEVEVCEDPFHFFSAVVGVHADVVDELGVLDLGGEAAVQV